MYHEQLFHETPQVWTPIYTELWSAAVQAKAGVDFVYPSEDQANRVKDSCNEMGLNAAVQPATCACDARVTFSPENDGPLTLEWMAAVGRKHRRIVRHGKDTPTEIAFRLLDELHAKLQIAVNRNDGYVLIENPVKEYHHSTDIAPYPLEIAQLFSDMVALANPLCRMCLVSIRCMLWNEEGILLWNWSGKNERLGDLGPAYFNHRDIDKN